MPAEIDGELLRDFLTEATELIEQLDRDLVTLEEAGSKEAVAGLMDSIFRALHTVKGAAGFLNLEELTHFAHAAEDALNRLRQGQVPVTAQVIDALLSSVDVLRAMVEALAEGEALEPCPEALMDQLRAISEGKVSEETADVLACIEAAPGDSISNDISTSGADGDAAATDAGASPGLQMQPLKLPTQKLDLLQFMTADLIEAATQIRQCAAEAKNPAARCDVAAHLVEISEDLQRTATFFELESLTVLVGLLHDASNKLGDAPPAVEEELQVRIAAMGILIDQQAQALDQSQVVIWPLEKLIEHVGLLVSDQALPAEVHGAHGGDPQQVLMLDGVFCRSGLARTEIAQDESASCPGKPGPTEEASPAAKDRREGDRRQEDRRQGDRRAEGGAAGGGGAMEATIRVEVGRLESLLNLVGQMVLTKNRVLSIHRKLQQHDLPQELTEDIAGAAGDLDRLTSNLQVGVMRTRMQPLAKLLDRYPRVIRDIARSTGKQIRLDITGKQTEVDKSVIELLADPLVHILRNSADHGIETPEARKEQGKDETGTIRLLAEHQGSHVRIEVIDDGNGIDRKIVGRKAVENGLASADQVASMSDEDVFQFIFAPGFSTAEKVTDLSGRGVGMDVVRTNVAKMNGTITVASKPGKGTSITILIPLTVAIMPAMVVEVGDEEAVGRQLYCVPLQSIVEIVRVNEGAIHTVSGLPVIRLRDSVLPLVDLRDQLEATSQSPAKFAVVITAGGRQVGLMVDRLIGQQDIVIKPLDDAYSQGGPFSGATIREDGRVSLILDTTRVLRQAGAAHPREAERRAA